MKQSDFEKRVADARDIELARSMECNVFDPSKLIFCRINFPGNFRNWVLTNKVTVNPGSSFSASIDTNKKSFIFNTDPNLEAPVAAETCVRIGKDETSMKKYPDLMKELDIDEIDGIYDEIECNPSEDFESALIDSFRGDDWHGQPVTTKDEQLKSYMMGESPFFRSAKK